MINNEVCYSEFYDKYLIMNRPCLLSKTHTESWLSRKLWAENELPSWENLLDSYGTDCITEFVNVFLNCYLDLSTR